VEPFFFITYYAKIIPAWFNMPAVGERSIEAPFRMGPGGEGGAIDGNTYLQWITPSATGAIIGVFIYSVICLTIAYIIYRKRQI
jgi:ABC-type transport system involved in multi-copper enzyme maturation permease subunit